MAYDPHNHVNEQAVVTRSERQPVPLVDAAGYTGYAPLGTPENESAWLITRTMVRGGVTYTEYPNGRMDYNQRWDQRASLYYAR